MTRDDSLTLQRLISNSLARRFPPQLANRGDTVGMTISTLHEVERGSAAVILLCVDLTEQVRQPLIRVVPSVPCFSVVYDLCTVVRLWLRQSTPMLTTW